jgi:glycerol-3-phosphate dehydrogenase
VADRVVDRVFVMRGQKPVRSHSATTPLYGGQIEQLETFVRTETAKHPQGLGEAEVRRLIANYGTAYPNVLKYLDACPAGDAVMRAEVRHAVREEMAQRLSDVIFRRMELGTAGEPGASVLRVCAGVMQAELGWSAARTEQECQLVHERYTLARF